MSECMPIIDPSDKPEREYLSSEDYSFREFLKWERGVNTAVNNERQKWVKKPGFNPSLRVPSYQPWEAPDLLNEERERLYADIRLDEFYATHDNFSPAAHVTVHSPEAAEFFDNIKCDYLGHSMQEEWFREISPTANHTPFEVQFDYDIGRIKHFTESGMIVHVRETSDPTAKTREQKLFIVVANLMTGELKRLYADNLQDAGSNPGLANTFNSTILLQSRHLSGVQGQYDIDTENDFAVTYHEEISRILARRQAGIRYQNNGLAFKPEGYGGYETLHRIEKLDEERHLLGKLALHAGQHLNERGAVEYTSHRLSIAN